MPEVTFVMSARQPYALRELAETLRYELEAQDVPCAVHLGGFAPADPPPVYVLLDPVDYVRAEGEAALPDAAILRRTIFVCVESPPAAGDTARLELLRRAGAVFAIDQRTMVGLQRVDIPARLLRPGYSRSLDRFDPDAPRPIDVLFLGVRSDRRDRYLSACAEALSRYECRFELADSLPLAEDVDAPLAGGRWPLLSLAKLVIGLHAGEEPRVDWRATLDAIHAGAVVVTEHSSGIGLLVPGEHLFVSSPDALPYVAGAALRDEARLDRVRRQAHERLSGWIPSALWVSVLRAAVVELVGEPMPEGARLSRTGA